LHSAVVLWISLGVMGAGFTGLVIYSYLVWKHDPERTALSLKTTQPSVSEG
jgi:hypothetical protein